MNAERDDNSKSSKFADMLYRAAIQTAVVSGVFSLISVGLLLLNFYKGIIVEPRLEEQWEQLKTEVRNKPNDEELLSRVRELDLEMRTHRVRQDDFSRRGGYLLLGGLTVFLVSLKGAVHLRKKLPRPEKQGDIRGLQVRDMVWGRRAATVVLIVLGSWLLVTAFLPALDFGRTISVVASYPSMDEIARNWPRFRGPEGAGISAYNNVPTEWDGKTGKNILWKSKVPLPGNSSPVVWRDRVFVSGANKKSRQIFCFDAFSGALLWSGSLVNPGAVSGEPPELNGDTAGYAAPTPVADGQRVCAIFPTGDIGCFDFDGRLLWSRNLGLPDSVYGYASSLEMYQNMILIQYDQGYAEDEKSAVLALDFQTGRTIWEMKRPVSNSWTSPIVVQIDSEFQYITCSNPFVIGYDPKSGQEIWRVECLGPDVAPSAIYANGLVFAIEPYAAVYAIRPQIRGDSQVAEVVWIGEDGIPDITSPVSDGQLLFLLTTYGILTCYDITDEVSDKDRVNNQENIWPKLWEQELDMEFNASASLVGDKLYLLSTKGIMTIAQAGRNYKEIARCELGEECYASPAFADGRIYIRGVENLYCIGNKD
jgi:outer membrane protein assembly factor BamB